MEIKTFYERNLPHLVPIGKTLFVTPCLAGSIPKAKLEQWRQEKEAAIEKTRLQFTAQKDFTGAANSQLGEKRKELLDNIHKRYFKRVDDFIDKGTYGPTYLKEPKAAELLVKKIHQYDETYYDLIAFTIMSNHFHFLIDPSIQIKDVPDGVPITSENYVPLETMMHRIKGGSSFEINKILGRTGQLWQPESYDRYPRTEIEFYNIIRYIANNPVKAGLVKHWSDYPFTYVKKEYLDAML